MTDEKTLLQSRKSIESTLTRIENFIRDKTKLDSSEVTVRQSKVEELWDKYDVVQAQLEVIDPDKYEESEDRDRFEEQYFRIMAQLDCFKPKPVQAPVSTGKGQPLETNGTVRNLAHYSYLPKLSIPVFSGDYREWKNFHDLYVSIIHENDQIAPIEKINYLKGSLKGEALKIIQSVAQSGDNYTEAWNLLVERYENKQFNMNIHLGAILEQPAVTKDSVVGLRSMITETKQHLASLKSLELPVDTWDFIIIYLLSKKLDPVTRREWELSKDKKNVPTLKLFFEFLDHRCTAMELIAGPAEKERDKKQHQAKNTLVSFKSNKTEYCKLCNGKHPLYLCETFIKSSTEERSKAVKTTGVCYNCLRSGHGVRDCHARRCTKCDKKHNTMLHFDAKPNTVAQQSNETTNVPIKDHEDTTEGKVTNHAVHETTEVILSTVMINVMEKHGTWKKCRALLDSGSQCNFASTKLLKTLEIQPRKGDMPIKGINDTKTKVQSTAWLQISSTAQNYHRSLEFWILDRITSELPQHHFKTGKWRIPTNIELADPTFNTPGEIDMLLGAEIYFDILRKGRVKLDNKLPIIQNTAFGWVVAGSVAAENGSTRHTFFTRSDTLEQNLVKFWEIENIPGKKHQTKEERECEEFFENTVRRNEDGRYIVRLPMKKEEIQLGDSYNEAYRQLLTLEKRFRQNAELQKQYCDFMQEYHKLDHMEVVQNPTNTTPRSYYMPHHPVFKESRSTTKLRVVFNASMKSSNDTSLNDLLLVGPVVHEDLFVIILRFRCYRIAVTADIIKMYRQIQIDENDRDLQRILWRNNENEEVQTYRMKTVTYGTASAPYLATRCIQQLANDEETSPETKDTLKHNFYVDDLLGGANSVNQAINLQNELIQVLRKGGFELHKWSSNSSELLENVPPERREAKLSLTIGKNSVKALGLTWIPTEDKLTFSIELKENKNQDLTKRIILSDVASIFDPLGILGPVVTKAKIFIQTLWKEKANWDDKLNQELSNEWQDFRTELNNIKQFTIDRLITQREDTNSAQIHGFSDASESAFGACVYLRTTSEHGNVDVKLITSKSRVAPIKQISIPRLELCGALTLARLINKVKDSLNIETEKIYLWSDSTIVLSWLKSEPTRWKTFVANRVSEIQELTENCIWRHVQSANNPADSLSRGQTVNQFLENDKWLHGPAWLKNEETEWPQENYGCLEENELPEIKVNRITHICTNTNRLELFNRISSFTRLQRTVAYCFRFIANSKIKENKKEDRTAGPLTTEELNKSLNFLIQQAQREEFESEISLLTANQPIMKSKLVPLNPFVDDKGILRVGGRLSNANVSFNQKFPIILPPNHKFTKLLIEYEHKRILHGGTQATLASLRRKYWPLNGRNVTRRIIYKCNNCFRFQATNLQQIMGNLPSYRTQSIRPFAHTGIDYAGPIAIKQGINRKSATTKAYIALFICLNTRSIHLELVSNLTKDAFINALKRFIARRGKCVSIHSDNATNFKGANNELQELQRLFNDTTKTEIIEFATNQDDPSDTSFLTPAHFLVGDSLTAIPEPDLTEVKLSHLSRWQMIQHQLQSFWKQWSRSYLQHMQQRSKWQMSQPDLHVGALVLIREDNQPPLNWARGRVTEVYVGTDNCVRVVSVKTVSGVIKRPVNKLCLLPSEIDNY